MSVLAAARSGDGAALDALAAKARSLGARPTWHVTADDLDAVVAFHTAGDLTAVAALASAEPPPRLPRVVRDVHRVLALVDAGRSSEADALMEQSLVGPSPQSHAARRWVRLEIDLAAGRVIRALRYASMQDDSDADQDTVGPVYVLATVAHAWAAHDANADLPSLADNGWPSLSGAVVEQRALAEWSAGAAGADVATTFLEAATRWSSIHVRGELRCRWAAAEVLRSSGSGDPMPILLDLETRAVTLGMLPLLSRVRQSLRRAGVRATAQKATDRRAASTGLLSSREREVLVLAGKGLTAIVIGQQLGVAASTVETQIASAMLKLGARTRVQAAMMVAEGVAR